MGEAAPKDNSMEEILASIRRIISSDDEAPVTGKRTAEKDTRSASASAESIEAKPKEPPAEPQSSRPADTSAQASFRSQASTSTPAAGGAGTLAGLAQQLRGTKELDSADGKPDTLATESVSAQTDAIEDTQPEMVEADAASSDETGIDGTNDADAGIKTPPGAAASTSSTQNLADLAKSINEKIGAASRKSNGQSDTATATDDPGIEVPEAVVESLADNSSEPASPADTPSVAPRGEADPDQTLAGIAQTLQTNLRASDMEGVISDEEVTASGEERAGPVAGEGEARVASQPAAGADGPEAFKEALVSPSTQQAVSGSMSRLKQAASELSQAQVEATLRPLLKEWLDENLPSLVERMVQQEIDRIAAKAGGGEVEQNPTEDSLLQSKSA